MGWFDFLKRKKQYALPGMYAGMISRDGYNRILTLAKQYHQEHHLEVLAIKEGELVVVVNEEEQHRYLDNLIRVLSVNDEELWPALVQEHFDKLRDHSAAYKYFYKDFEYAAQFLRVLIKSDSFSAESGAGDYVQRTDLPGTNTFLVMEYEEQFRFIRQEDIVAWNKPVHELFAIAMDNLPVDEISVESYTFAEKFPTYAFFSGDYSAAMLLDLEAQADFSIGTYGALIALPTKGAAYVHPIERADVLELVQLLSPIVYKSFQEDPGAINTHFYWYHDGAFRIFPSEEAADGLLVRLPSALQSLFGND